MNQLENTDRATSRVRSGTALRDRGVDRVKHILDVAKKLFITRGYSNFSLRNVAKAAGISLGNLGYYFESKNDLFRSMVDAVLDVHRNDLRQRMSEAPNEPKARFLAVLDQQFDESCKADSRQFFYQFWAISIHDAFIAECRSNVYNEFREIVRVVCHDLNPKLSTKKVNDKTYLLMAQIEGLYVILGNDEIQPKQLKNLKKQFCQQALALVLTD